MTLLAEDVLLLLLDRETGRLAGTSKIRPLLGGAMLSELSLTGLAALDGSSSRLRPARVQAVGATPVDPLLASAHAMVAAKPRTPQALVDRLGKGLKDRLVGELVARGVLREEKGRMLGLVPQTRWPVAGASHNDTVRQRVSAALVLGQEPDRRTRAVVALLAAADVAHQVIDTQRLPTREVRRRAKALAEGDWAAKGVRDAIAAAGAAAAG